MICERCGHEMAHHYDHDIEDDGATCIANLRADLAIVEQSRDQWKQAAQNSTDIAMRGTAKLRAELYAETRACAAEGRAARAEAASAAMRAALERLYQATVTVDAHNRDAAYGARDALATDLGDRLTAVRTLAGTMTYEQGNDAYGWVKHCMECHRATPDHDDDCDMGKALTDPTLAALRSGGYILAAHTALIFEVFWAQVVIAALLSWVEHNSYGMRSWDKINESTAAWNNQ